MITTTIEMITPKMAEKMLETNVNNRKINERNLDYLIDQIKKDNFHLTGESIKFNKQGSLIDGQHRLTAIVQSNKSVKLQITRGLENDIFKFIDTGRNRTAGDVLSIKDVNNATTTAATCKFIMNFKKNKFHSASSHESNKRCGTSNFEISEFYDKNSDSIDYSVTKAMKVKAKLISSSQLAGLHFLFKAKDFSLAETFLEKLGNGVDLKEKNPIFVLREKLIQDKINKLKLLSIDKLALTIKAWNFFREDKKISRLMFDSKKEEFPKIQ